MRPQGKVPSRRHVLLPRVRGAGFVIRRDEWDEEMWAWLPVREFGPFASRETARGFMLSLSREERVGS